MIGGETDGEYGFGGLHLGPLCINHASLDSAANSLLLSGVRLLSSTFSFSHFCDEGAGYTAQSSLLSESVTNGSSMSLMAKSLQRILFVAISDALFSTI